uniref:glutathione transferase n=1 Tax=Parastrongyloides trichosuri TaxID=131310 RepID=A0A0N4ZM93_PARTI
MSKYTLIYFGVRGYGEPARLMFNYAKVPFEDRIIDQQDWPELKKSMPFEQLPVLEYDKTMIAQSFAIYRFLGKQFKLYPLCKVLSSLVDGIGDYVKEFDQKVGMYFLVSAGFKEGDKEELLENNVKPAIKAYFPTIEKWLKKSGTGYLTKAGLTWVDFFAAEKLGNIVNSDIDEAKNYSEIKKYVDKFYNLPGIKEYVEKRPKLLY